VQQLSSLLKSSATQTQYDSITNVAQMYATNITAHEGDLEFFVQKCPPLAENATPPDPDKVDPFCPETKPVMVSELQTEFTLKYYENVENYIRDNGALGTEGMLHLYSLWLGESKQFFRTADSTKMQNLYNYWDQVLTSAANLRMEWFHYLNYQDPSSPAGNATITRFIGNPDGTPPPGVVQADRAANLHLMFPPVPDGTVISTQDHIMWALVPWVQTGYSEYPIYQILPRCWTGQILPFYITGSFAPSYAGFKGWWWSSKPQWQAAVSLAPTNGSVAWRDWLIQQTKTTADELPDYLERVLRRFQAARGPDETFATWASRASEEDFL
jgi:hypothetical protein